MLRSTVVDVAWVGFAVVLTFDGTVGKVVAIVTFPVVAKVPAVVTFPVVARVPIVTVVLRLKAPEVVV